MMQATFGALVAIVLIGLGFGLGHWQAGQPSGPVLAAQGGRGPIVPAKPRSRPPTTEAAPLVYGGDSGSAAMSANGFMAVTGSYGVGTSVLYLFDTNNKQLLVYEARGGSQSMRRLVLVGARRIDLDLQLMDYNDESEYSRAALGRMMQGGAKPKAKRTVTAPGDLGTGEYKTTKRDSKTGKK